MNADGTVNAEQKISSLSGGLPAVLANNDAFGASVAAIGDTSGDGTPDLLVGADADDDGGSDRGAVYLLFMNADMVNSQQKISSTTGGLSVALDDDGWFGVSAASLGDLNGDGILDLLVGADKNNDGGNNRSAVYVLNPQAASSTARPCWPLRRRQTAIDEDDTTRPATASLRSSSTARSVTPTAQWSRSRSLQSTTATAPGSTPPTTAAAGTTSMTVRWPQPRAAAGRHAGRCGVPRNCGLCPPPITAAAPAAFRAWDQSSGSASRHQRQRRHQRLLQRNGQRHDHGQSGQRRPDPERRTLRSRFHHCLQHQQRRAGCRHPGRSDQRRQRRRYAGHRRHGALRQQPLEIFGRLQQRRRRQLAGCRRSRVEQRIAAGSNSWLRYVPDGSNAEIPTVTFHAWDQSSGSASTGTQSYADSGSGSAFSSGNAQAS